MFENKKLFIVTFLVTFVICLFVNVPVILLHLVEIGSVEHALFFIGNGILGIISYSLMYKSLKKSEIIKKLYRLFLIIGVLVFVIG